MIKSMPRIFMEQMTEEPAAGESSGLLTSATESGDVQQTAAQTETETHQPEDSQVDLPEWRAKLPEDIRNDKSLDVIKDLEGLAKGYVNAQKMVGKDKISLPDKHATEEDWQGVFKKLGLPEEPGQYEVKFDTDAFTQEDVDIFKEIAHAAGVLPSQVQKAWDTYSDKISGVAQQMAQDSEAQIEKAVEELKGEWGQAFERKVNEAVSAFKAVATEEEFKYVNESGLANDPKLVKMFARIHEQFMKEDQVVGPDGKSQGVFTPSEAQGEINRILGDSSHPYHDDKHPNHKAAVQEVTRLFEMKSNIS